MYVSVCRNRYNDAHLQSALLVYVCLPLQLHAAFCKIKYGPRSCVNICLVDLPNVTSVFTDFCVSAQKTFATSWKIFSLWTTVPNSNAHNHPSDLQHCQIVFKASPTIRMQRFGFHMSNGSLIGLQDIYRYYGPESVEDSQYPYVPTDAPDWSTEAGNLEPELRKGWDVHNDSWVPHPEAEKVAWMSEPDLFSKHPNSQTEAVLESKESYHSLASLVNWQRLLSDMAAVSFCRNVFLIENLSSDSLVYKYM